MTEHNITIDFVRRMLPTDRNGLDDELEVQASVLERISAQVVRANTRSIRAKEDLARVEAGLLEDVQHEAVRDGVKVTVDQAASRVRRSPARLEAWDRWSEARALHEEWSGLHEAWRTKGFNIKALGELYASQYFAINSAGAPRDRGRRDEPDSAARERIRDAPGRPRRSLA